MLKKISVLVPLLTLCLWAADFWTAKPFTEWSDKEVNKIISDSPWAQKVTISASFGGGPGIAESAGGGGRGGRGGGGGGGRGGGPQGDAATADPGIDGGGGGGFGGGVPAGVSVTLLWQTALPVKQALAKRKFGAEAGTSPDAKAAVERVDQVYVLTLSGLPGSLLAATQGDKKAALLAVTTVTANGKPPLQAADLQASGGRGMATVSFLFPKTATFTAEDKEIEFSTKFDKTAIKKKFKLKDMVVNGKVEM